MLTVSLYIFLLVYFAFLALFTIFAIINIAHIIHTNSFTFCGFLMTLFTFIATILVLWTTIYLLSGANWQQQITIFDSTWISNVFNF
jgi:hypothetical protein